MTPQYKIGTQFNTRGKHPKLSTITDILTTYNSAGEVVKIRYVALHSFMGQMVADYDVCDATVARGLVRAA